ncbi:uncharacterized protein LOC141912321 [Tubulanus polymorphus]|uniref:uncharacterized protein LOC141912321 n=1 Tax=Tubulanus polymorphus TaxID=672921 RepID=UPI003DA36E3B
MAASKLLILVVAILLYRRGIVSEIIDEIERTPWSSESNLLDYQKYRSLDGSMMLYSGIVDDKRRPNRRDDILSRRFYYGCPSVCRCYYQRGHGIANCRNKGLTKFPRIKNNINILDLSQNRIKSIKPFRRLPRLDGLGLRENALSSLVGRKSLHYLPNLILLDVSCNPVRFIGKQALMKNKHLKTFVYNFFLLFKTITLLVRKVCPTKHTVKDIHKLFHSLQNCAFLEELQLRGAWHFEPISLTASISKYLPVQNLKILSLRYNRIPEIDIGFFYGFKSLEILQMNYCKTNFRKHQFKGLVNLQEISLVLNNIHNLNLTEIIISSPKLKVFNAHSSHGLTCFDSRTSFAINNTLTELDITCIIGLVPTESPCGDHSGLPGSLERVFYLREDIKNLRQLQKLVITLDSPAAMLCLKSFDLLPESMDLIGINNLAGPFNYYLNKLMFHNACESLMWNKTFYKLVYLRLTGTIIGECPSHVIHHILSRVPSVETLDLSSNGIRHLDRNTFESTPRLQDLSLKYNRLSTIQPGLLKPLTNLRVLNLASNQLKTFDPDEIINLRHFRSIFLLGNTFECDCQLRKLRNWLKELNSHRTNNFCSFEYLVAAILHKKTTFKLLCTSPRKLSGVAIADFQLHWIECDNHKDVVISLSTICVTVIIIAIGRIVAKKKWQIYYWWMVKINRFLPKLLRIATVSRSDDMKFDGFLSHSMEDLQFVYLDFIPEIEKSKDFASKFCIEFRDFTIGGYIQQNNIDAIYGSRWVVFLLTESFIEERWVEFVISMAANRCVEEGNNIILVLDIDHIPESRMPESLRTIISNVVYMKYPRDDKARSTFWKKVRLTLIGKQRKFIQPANMYRSNR